MRIRDVRVRWRYELNDNKATLRVQFKFDESDDDTKVQVIGAKFRDASLRLGVRRDNGFLQGESQMSAPIPLLLDGSDYTFTLAGERHTIHREHCFSFFVMLGDETYDAPRRMAHNCEFVTLVKQ